MTYSNGLGQINIARDASTAIRAFQAATQVAAPVAPAPSPWPTVTRVTTFTQPVLKAPTPTTAILVKPSTTTVAAPTPTPVFKPTVAAPKPATATPQNVTGMKPVSGGIITESLKPSTSQLPLLAIAGIGLLLFLRKKGR
jgi:hypothetical protein